MMDWADVRSYGAAGDGGAEDAAAIQAAITAHPTGTVFVPGGTYIVSRPLAGMRPGFRLTGNAGSILKSKGCAILDFGTVSTGAVEIDHLTLDADGGHAVIMPRMSRGRFHDLTITQRSPDHSIWDGSGSTGILECTWEKITASTAAASRTVPAWNFTVTGGNDLFNENTFAEIVASNNGADGGQPVFSVSCPVAGATYQNNTWRDITFENPLGGCVRILSGHQTTLQSCRAWDLSAPPSSPLFEFGTDAGSGVGPAGTAIRDCGRSYGPVGARTPPDIRLGPACSQTLISNYYVENAGAPAVHPWIDLGGSSGIVIAAASADLNLAGTAGAEWTVIGSGVPRYTDPAGTVHAMRPAAAAAPDAGGATASGPDESPGPSDFSYLAWSYDPVAAVASLAPNSGAVYASRVPVRARVTASRIVYGVASADGMALRSGECFAGLYDSTGRQVAVTADIVSAVAAGEIAFPFTSPVTLAPGWYWAAILLNGTTTPPLARGGGIIPGLGSGQAGPGGQRFGTIAAGRKSMPKWFTPARMGPVTSKTYWAALA